jgi:5'-nucleotidase
VKNLDGKEIPVDQNGKHAIYVGKLMLDFDNK